MVRNLRTSGPFFSCVQGLNTKIVPNKRLEARDLKNGSYFTTPLDCCDGYNTS